MECESGACGACRATGDAYCDCFADGIEKNWKKYSLMGTEKMVAEIMNDGEELSIACIDVFADFVN